MHRVQFFNESNNILRFDFKTIPLLMTAISITQTQASSLYSVNTTDKMCVLYKPDA